MFSKDDILKQLREGIPAETIAEAMSKEINNALAAYTEEQRAADARTKTLKTKARVIADAIADFFNEFDGTKLSEKEREDLAQTFLTVAEKLSDLEQALVKADIPKEDEDVIKAFLDTFIS